MNQKSDKNKLGLWMCTSLVVGNIIGVGIFLVPVTLAGYGAISFVGWAIAAVGALLLARVFAHLSMILPGVNGGPYAFSRAGMGDFAGFLVAWGFYISIWVTNAAIAVGFVGYLSVFLPIVTSTHLYAGLTGLSAIWLLTWLNTKGIRHAGIMQLITSALKLVPLLLVAVGGLFFIRWQHFETFNVSDVSSFSAIATTTSLTFFSFLGLESATFPAASVQNPTSTIPRATLIGTFIAIVVYMLGCFSVMGILSPGELALSYAPFADAAAIMWGKKARYIVAAGAVISTFGALNGWILVQGQLPAAISADRLFPKIFSRINQHGVPALGLVIGSVFATILMMMNYTKGLAAAFEFFILLSTLSVLIPYLFSTISYLVVAKRNGLEAHRSYASWILAIMALVFIFWVLIGMDMATILWGAILLIAGVPFYLVLAKKSSTNK